ncbi:MAG: hypothetical protein RI965_395 [Bacteroidota bacterium]|jgi:ORF6N domain
MKLEVVNEKIIQRIYIIRGVKVMIDFELAELYKIETKQMKRQVKRNIERFPADFMFVLNKEELEILRCQIGTFKQVIFRYPPMAFTEQGVAMLSSVLNSSTAIAVNIEIIRVFSRMKELAIANKEVLLKLEELENKVNHHQDDIKVIFEALKQLIHKPNPPRERIGFRQYD